MLYRNLAAYTITDYGDLDLLRFYKTIGAGPSKPSWVVDWGTRSISPWVSIR